MVTLGTPPADAGLDSLLIAEGIHAAEFGMTGGEQPDLARIEAALIAGSYHPVAVARSFRW